ncbi:class F sortase [Ornithinimicrobium pratense]|uniref:Class F sortase n=1 Tax=Ornithinimicrobium pratense TaxID=2593973 RepID=A0A5J6V680_9MICO|nr:class F sortase [Ornithinimicrobium pratense]QFG68543.1 class F sortase [Ornithinimicrobium pratense]
MTEDVRPPVAGQSRPGGRRPGLMLHTLIAFSLLISGGAAVAVGLSHQGSTPAPPALSAPTTQPEATTEPPTDTATTADPAPTADPAATADPAPATGPAPTGSATSIPTASASTPATAEPTQEAAPVALPVSVSIPAIDVTSDLLHLGLNPDGTLQVPQGPDFDSAAWYDGSPRPGEVGPAVLEGHVSSIGRGPSIFFNLTQLQVGDTIDVTRQDGTIATFEVYDLQQFPKDSFPTVQVYGPTKGPELRLITCGGTIAQSTGRFADNIIIFARET